MTPSVAHQQPTLLTLPQEIQDIIFDYAYSDLDVRLSSLADWKREERWSRGYNDDNIYPIESIPAPFVDQFMVSKVFFVAAARAWAHNYDFSDLFMDFACDDMSCSCHGNVPTGIVAAFATATRSMMLLDERFEFNKLLELRELKIPAMEMVWLYIADQQLVRDVKLDQEEFQAILSQYEPLRSLRGLRTVKACHLLYSRVDEGGGGGGDGEKYDDAFIGGLGPTARACLDVDRDNDRRFLEYVRAHVTQPKANDDAADCGKVARAPLYPGSKVCWAAASEQKWEQIREDVAHMLPGILFVLVCLVCNVVVGFLA